MSEFSKLASRIDAIHEALTSIATAHCMNVADFCENSVGISATVDSETYARIPLSGTAGASQSISTTTSATPDIRNQYAWRSSSSAAGNDKDEYTSIEGKELLAHYDTTVMISNELVSKILPSTNLFVSKANTKDSVTDLPRYGAVMKLKIMTASEKAIHCSELATNMTEKLSQLVKDENDKKEGRRMAAEKAASEELKRLQLLQAESLKDKRSHADIQKDAMENILKCRAEESRQRRRYLSGILQQLLSVLNRREKSVRSIEDAVKRMKIACGEEQIRFKTAITVLISLLQEISSKPDKVALRRLRIAHKQLHSQVTGIDGGIALLLALGFNIKIDTDVSKEVEKEVVGVFSSAGGVLPVTSASTSSSSSTSNDTEYIDRIYSLVHAEIIKHENISGNNDNDLINKKEIGGNESEKFLILFGEDALARKYGHIGEKDVTAIVNEDTVKNAILSSDVLNWTMSHQDYSELFFLANNANNWNSTYPGDNIDKKEKENSEDLKMKNKEQKREERQVLENEKKEDEKEKYADVTTEVKDDVRDKVQQLHTSITIPIPVMLEMVEPNPDTASGMDKWLIWYESLKSSSELLQSLL